jgi:hypothetical protein
MVDMFAVQHTVICQGCQEYPGGVDYMSMGKVGRTNCCRYSEANFDGSGRRATESVCVQQQKQRRVWSHN